MECLGGCLYCLVMDCLIDYLCCFCCREGLEIIEPKEIECRESSEPSDPDYIPLYMEMAAPEETVPKYTNMAP